VRRSDAKAATAGSNRRRVGKRPAFLLVLLAASVAALALVVGPASATQTHLFKEVFGSAEQPEVSIDRGLAIDQGTEDLHVIDSTQNVLHRFNPDGTAADFGALGENTIDGEGTGDETPQGNLAFSTNRQREQVAIDRSGEATDGNIYVTQSARDVVSIFNEEGEFLGQLTESTEGGAFGEPCGVAVDDEGTVYVGDRGDDRIHVYDPAASPPVNADNTASYATVTDPCTMAAGIGATAGFLFVNASTGAQLRKVDAATGEVKYEIATGGSTVTVNPADGHVFAARNTGSSSTVDEYDASGATEAEHLSTIQPGSTVEGVAVNETSGEIYLSRASTNNIEVYEAPIVTAPAVVTEAPASNTGTRATLAGTVNPDGVELDECFFEWGENVAGNPVYGNVVPCAQTPGEIGAGTTPVAVEAEIASLIPQGKGYEYRLVAVNENTTVNGSNQTFSTPDTVLTEAASGVAPTEATLNGTVNPDTETISECVFEWGPEKGPFDPVQTFPETAPCVPGPGGIGEGTSPVAVAAELSGLHPGTTYVYRLRAAYPTGPIADNSLTVQTLGPRIADTWAEDVVITEAILKAEIDPEGEETTFRFEYGPSEAYGSETPESLVGSDSSVHEVTAFLEGLEPGTTYHYRVVATNGVAVNEGPDREIRTFLPFEPETDCPNQAFRFGAAAALPDCRAYELVSPLDKNGGDIVSLNSSGGVQGVAVASRTQSAPSGDKLAYSSYRAFGDAASTPWSSQYIAQRVPGNGWQTHSLNQNPAGAPVASGLAASQPQYEGFSDDLCQAWMRNFFDPPLAEGALAGYLNLYRRSDRLCGPEGYEALAPLAEPLTGGPSLTARFLGASADSSHAIFFSTGQLSPEGGASQVYESVEGAAPRPVCILPGGEPWGGSCIAGSGHNEPVGVSIDGAISEDGERIFWTDAVGRTEGKVYVRIGGAETVPVSQAGEEEAETTESWFWGAAADGSRAVLTTGGFPNSHLYAFELEGEATEPIADGVYGVVGMSDDARRVYFLSSEALPGSGQNSEGEGARIGEPNLYLYDADQGGGTNTFIATLAAGDVPGGTSFYQGTSIIAREPRGHIARVTPDGLHVAFASEASLTGYDNEGLTNGNPFRLAYVYDAVSKELVCASCNPSGARGRTETNDESAVIPRTIPLPPTETALQPSRRLSDDGDRLIFESVNALAPSDTNGKADVYQWEAEGAGGCDADDARFYPAVGGCIELISTGESPFDSAFAEATPSGDDLFFYTASSLLPQDYGLRDIYDARVGGGLTLPPEPPDCFGDACQSVPPAPNDPTPASAAFRGAGDPVPRVSCGAAGKRATKQSRRAKRLRRAAKSSSQAKRKKALRRRAARHAKRAKRLSQSAKRCRRANRRANR